MASLDTLAGQVADLTARSKPDEGWSLSDFTADVSESILRHEEALDILEETRKAASRVTGFNEIYTRKDNQIANLESQVQRLLNAKETSLEIMEWWDANYRPIDDLRKNEQAKIDAEAAARRAKNSADSADTKARQAIQDIHAITSNSDSLISQFRSLAERAETAAEHAALTAAIKLRGQLADADRQVKAMEDLLAEAQRAIGNLSDTYKAELRKVAAPAEEILANTRDVLTEAQSWSRQFKSEVETKKQDMLQLVETNRTQILALKQQVDQSVENVEEKAIQAAETKLEEGNTILSNIQAAEQRVNNSISTINSNVDAKVAEIVAGAPQKYNTLLKLANIIETNGQVVSALETTVEGKMDYHSVSNNGDPNTLVKVNPNGDVLLYGDPISASAATRKSWVMEQIVQAIDGVRAGAVTSAKISDAVDTAKVSNRGKVLKVSTAGKILSEVTPSGNFDVVNKKYFDDNAVKYSEVAAGATASMIVRRNTEGKIKAADGADNDDVATWGQVLTRLNGKAESDHTHRTSDIIGFDAQLGIKITDLVDSEFIYETLNDSGRITDSVAYAPGKPNRLLALDSQGFLSLNRPPNERYHAANKEFVETTVSPINNSVTSLRSTVTTLQQKIATMENTISQLQQWQNGFNIANYIVEGNLNANDGKFHYQFE